MDSISDQVGKREKLVVHRLSLSPKEHLISCKVAMHKKIDRTVTASYNFYINNRIMFNQASLCTCRISFERLGFIEKETGIEVMKMLI